jgi:dienelactone hydrolase
VYVRGDSTAYCTGYPDPPIKVSESPGEEEVRQEAIDRIQTSVEMASSYSNDDNAKTNYLIFPPSDGDGDDNQTTPTTTMLKQACYLPSTADGIPMMGRLKENNRPQTFVCAGHTCWGILLGPASGEAMAHEIVTGQSPHIEMSFFAPERFGSPLQFVPSTTPKGSSSSTTNNNAIPSSSHWTPLDVNTFPNVISLDDGCRFAKDEQYLEAVMDLWKQEKGEIRKDNSSPQLVETSPLIYHDDDQTPLYGHIVRPIIDSDNNDDDNSNTLRPGILLFHTAAGPQDVFLFQKAAQLASSELQCIVLICDVLSDPDGWAWCPNGDRTKYNQVRKQLLQDNGRLLRSRVNASVQTLIGFVDNNNDDNENNNNGIVVDPNRLAGMGWCMGAQPILELLTLQQQQDEKSDEISEEDLTTHFSVGAIISYHGVFHRDSPLLDEESSSIIAARNQQNEMVQQRDVLICNGKSDPFISQNDLEVAKKLMEEKMYNVTVMEFDGAKHGFTNPAQNFNENDAFEYNEYAAKESWKATMELLKRRLL